MKALRVSLAATALLSSASALEFRTISPPEGYSSISLTGTSNNGEFLSGYASNFNLPPFGFRWSEAKNFERIFEPSPSTATHPAAYAREITPDGRTIIGDYQTSNGSASRLWREESGVSDLPLPVGSNGQSWASVVSSNGNFIGGTFRRAGGSLGDNRTTLWSASTNSTIILQDQNGSSYGTSSIGGMSADGSIIVGTNSTRPFIWEANGSLTFIPNLYADQTRQIGSAISGNGTTVIGYVRRIIGETTIDSPYVWNEGGIHEALPLLPTARRAYANEINFTGNLIAGIAVLEDGTTTTFIWDQFHGTRDLKSILVDLGYPIEEWDSFTISDISEDGTALVGNARDANFNSVGWQITNFASGIPEPSTLVLLLLSTAAALRRKR